MAPCIFKAKPKKSMPVLKKTVFHLYAKLFAWWAYPLALTIAPKSKELWREGHESYLEELKQHGDFVNA